MQRRLAAGGKESGAAIAEPGRLPPRSPSQKAVGAVLSDTIGKRCRPTGYKTGVAAGPIPPSRIMPQDP